MIGFIMLCSKVYELCYVQIQRKDLIQPNIGNQNSHCKLTAYLLQHHCKRVAVALQSSCSTTANLFAVTLQLVCSTTAKSMHHLCSGKSLIVRYGSSSSSCLLQSFHILSSSLFVLSFDRWQYNLSFPARFISWNFHIFVSISMLHKCVREECIRQ